jgi:thioesterase domain-containing protein
MFTEAAQTLTKTHTQQFEIPDWVQSPVSAHMIRLMNDYRPKSCPDICVEVIRELDEFRPPVHPLRPGQASHLPDAGWDHWTRQPNYVHWLPGDHVSILRPPVLAKLAGVICEAHNRYLKTASDGKTPAPSHSNASRMM